LITDYIVVGGGTAGCIVASRLTEIRQWNVLLLEAGGASPKPEASVPSAWPKAAKGPMNWGSRTLPEKHLGGRALAYPQGKGLGGTTNIFAGIYSLGDRFDYNAWRELGNPGWGWDYVEPYFEKPFREGMPREPLRWVHPFSADFVKRYAGEGAQHWQVLQRRGRKVTVRDVYLGRVEREGRSNLTTVCDAQVTRVIFDGRRAKGVEVLRNGKLETIQARVEVILCAGALQTPAILMRSGIGPRRHLEGVGIEVLQDLPGVGENLQEHVRAGVEFASDAFPQLEPEAGLWEQAKYRMGGGGPLSSPLVEAGALLRSQAEAPAPDLQLNFVPKRRLGNGFAIWTALLRPFSRGYLRLRSGDPTEQPDLHLNVLEEPEDRRTLETGVQWARRWGAAMGEAGAETTYGLMWHAAGTTRMGEDRMSVVDSNLRVHGIGGLRVIDAGVMPVIPSGNTAVPVMMVAERGVDLVRC
jgi:choline dehydrogenase